MDAELKARTPHKDVGNIYIYTSLFKNIAPLDVTPCPTEVYPPAKGVPHLVQLPIPPRPCNLHERLGVSHAPAAVWDVHVHGPGVLRPANQI